ncbi:polyphosphate kinase 1 [Flavilitoribacter nigricans]|uniref:Polyphosphate kinase n=1 Tax=Flavilitoribacter nigricans (strain ATCC 23147 / DSM 23189 / NBRC 102662 / NCIMB 1420 / SS-2) TaxID=1122177 RepID=A0A2D0N354_FLAN2|nr:polyphosphate kinase 1 [Flavilitoribacter nigricans]PHN02972.1 polyphosphate kinase 1 [Flavilitoribacter nigricans DSM 23189 = NBRC 102662]
MVTEFTKEKELPLVARDISWLSFNERVLQEARDHTVPLFERIKFLAIYSSNLDEFFRVRMANHRNLLRVGKKTKKELDIDPKQTVKEIQEIVNEQQEEFSRIFQEEIIPELKKHNINILRRLDLNEEQKEFVENYFRDHMLPFVQPVLLFKDKIRPFLNNAALYLSVLLKPKDNYKADYDYAIVKIPSDHLPRFIQLPSPSSRYDIIMLDDIVRHSISWMFPGYHVIDTYSIKLTRDAELYIDDEFSGNLIQKIKSSLTKRHVGPASRFVYDSEMPEDFLNFLMEVFDLDKYDLLREGRYHNNFDFFRFPDFGMGHLKNSPLPPLPYKPLEETKDFFQQIREKDHMIYVPYHSYESVVRFFEQAAHDPKVTHIKIVQYRVARKSRIMDALINAVRSGKQVSVFIEVKARFDEEANLEWGEKLSKAGVTVHYSFPGVKVHSKLALVRRLEKNGPTMYTYLSTGNFHEDTAKIYSDFGLFTADERLVYEVARVFSFLETEQVPAQPFEHLLVGQFNLRSDLESLINYEIEQAKADKPASIILKMNSLQDETMIEKLYEASMAGVQVTLIIRGICCLVPGLPESENIHALSIVDRFLEHSRVFIFHHGGEELTYLSSADWMTRNLSYRVETAFPIYDPALRREIREYINIQLMDNVKARVLDATLSNTYYRNGSLAIRSQRETYYYIKRQMEAEKLSAKKER